MGTLHGLLNTPWYLRVLRGRPGLFRKQFWGPRALHAAKCLKKGGGYQKFVGKNILRLEKIGWVGILSL